MEKYKYKVLSIIILIWIFRKISSSQLWFVITELKPTPQHDLDSVFATNRNINDDIGDDFYCFRWWSYFFQFANTDSNLARRTYHLDINAVGCWVVRAFCSLRLKFQTTTEVLWLLLIMIANYNLLILIHLISMKTECGDYCITKHGKPVYTFFMICCFLFEFVVVSAY